MSDETPIILENFDYDIPRKPRLPKQIRSAPQGHRWKIAQALEQALNVIAGELDANSKNIKRDKEFIAEEVNTVLTHIGFMIADHVRHNRPMNEDLYLMINHLLASVALLAGERSTIKKKIDAVSPLIEKGIRILDFKLKKQDKALKKDLDELQKQVKALIEDKECQQKSKQKT